MQHAEVLQQLHHSRVRAPQLDSAGAGVFLAQAHLEAEPSQHAQERAVHKEAFGQIEHEVAIALLPKLIYQRLERDTRIEIGPPNNADAGEFFADENQYPGWGYIHALPSLQTKFVAKEECRVSNEDYRV